MIKFILIFIFFGTAFFSSGQDLDMTELFYPVELKGDSGYLVKGDVESIVSFLSKETPFLNYRKLEVTPSYLKDKDTLGKFIYLPLQNRYFVCMNLFTNENESHLILQLKKAGEKVILEKLQIFDQWKDTRCWGYHFDGFTKWNDFLLYKNCGTGSSLVSSHWLLMTELVAQSEINPFLKDLWISDEGVFKNIQSTISLEKGVIVLSYSIEEGIIEHTANDILFTADKAKNRTLVRKGIFNAGKLVFDAELPDLDY